MLEIVRIPVLQDNYIWLVNEPTSGATAVIDPAVAEPVLEAAHKRGWHISHILNTHWHPDHVGGNAAIKAVTGCHIIGPLAERDKITAIDETVVEGDIVNLGTATARVIDVPGHTAGHNAYYFADDQALFCGDTLFAMGCGRLFEGSPAQMWASLAKFEPLPDAARVYCAHEYTLSNGKFALYVDGDNQALVERMADVVAKRASDIPTIPTTMALERATNPFLLAKDVAEFAARRLAKDNFKAV